MAFNRPYLTCRELVELVTEAEERALAPGLRARYQLHLGACSDCRAYVSQLRGTASALRGLAKDDSSGRRVVSELLSRFRQRKEKGQ